MNMEEKTIALLSTAYLGPVQYYTKLINFEQVLIESDENFQKQSYRNRCIILAANGKLPLTIPVTKDRPKVKTKEIEIDNTLDWQKQHWTSIESAYSSSPFFEFFMDEFRTFYEKKYKFLLDFNLEIQSYVLDQLGVSPTIKLTSRFIKEAPSDMVDFRETIHPKKRMQKKDEKFDPHFYYQVFGDKFGFIPNLSIIDLLFNEGANAENILVQSTFH
jgi:hypothetical protein